MLVVRIWENIPKGISKLYDQFLRAKFRDHVAIMSPLTSLPRPTNFIILELNGAEREMIMWKVLLLSKIVTFSILVRFFLPSLSKTWSLIKGLTCFPRPGNGLTSPKERRRIDVGENREMISCSDSRMDKKIGFFFLFFLLIVGTFIADTMLYKPL